MQTTRTSSARGLRLIGLALAASAFISPPARACSQLPRAIHASYPAPGAVGVPTNAVLYVSGEVIEATVLETAAGEPVDIVIRPAEPRGFDIIPNAELEPNQRYVLRNAGLSVLSTPFPSIVEFTTGSGARSTSELTVPDLSGATLLELRSSPCPYARLCLEPGAADSALLVSNGIEDMSEQSPGDIRGVYGGVVLIDGCLDVWRRDHLGQRSPSSELCASDITVVELASESALMTCDDWRRGDIELEGESVSSDGDAADAVAARCDLNGTVRSHSQAAAPSILVAHAALGVGFALRRRLRGPAARTR